MTVAFETGYTLPSGDLPLNHARVLHDGNRFKVKTITASSELSLYPGSAANSGDTVDRWRPFANGAPSPLDFSASDWTATAITVGSDGQTLTETTATSQHDISAAYTFTAAEHVLAFDVEPQTMPEVQVLANDGTTSFTCFFDLRDKTVGTAANCTGKIVSNNDGSVRLLIVFAPVAATGVIELLGSNGSETVSYAGSTSNTVKVTQAIAHLSEATLTYDLFTAQEGDTYAIAAHNLWSSGATLRPQYLGADATNLLTYSEQFDNAAWNLKTGVAIDQNTTAAPDGLTSGDRLRVTASGARYVGRRDQSLLSGENYSFSVFVKADVNSWCSLAAVGPTSQGEQVTFNVSAGELGAVINGSPVSTIIDFGGGWYRCQMSFLSNESGLWQIRILTADSASDVSVLAGSSVFIWGAQLQTGTEATSYIKTEATAVTSGWHDFDAWLSFADNSPMMFFNEPVTSNQYRIQISGGALPEIGVFRVGKSLQMERPFYGGFTIPRMARNAVVRGNISGSGELLGRSLERTTLNTQYQWQHLSYAWVRANLDGPNGLVQAAETEPLFLAWRPSETQDVDYVMRASTQAPNAMGLRDLFTFGMSGEAHSYE